jgi:exo-1,4-beta-D-glucosaminidase
MVHLRMTRGKGGEDLTPIFWSDNYFSLLPGEQKQVTATYDRSDLEGKAPILHVDGYNVTAQSNELP